MTMQSLRPMAFTILALVLVAVGLGSALAEPDKAVPSKAVSFAYAREKDIAPADLRYYWKRKLDLASNERILRMCVMDENVYFITNRNRLRALDASVGNPKWSVEIGNARNRIFQPTHVPDMRLPERIGTIDDIDTPRTVSDFDTFNAVLINSMTRLMVIDRKTGRIYRDLPFDGIVASDAGVSDGVSFFVGAGARMYCAIKLMPNVITWREELGQVVATPMGYYDRRIYMGTLDGLFRCAETDRYGAKRWERKLDGTILTKFHVDTRGVFLACNDKRIYAFHPYTGKNLWPPVIVKGSVGGPMQVGEKTLFQYIKDDGLYAVNVANGDVRWKKPAGRKVLAMIDGAVYVLDEAKKLHRVNEITGKTDAVVSLRGFNFYADNTNVPAIFTATRNGEVFCIRPKKAGRLTVEQLTK